MKGFIEVTRISDMKVFCVNINHIASFGNNYIFSVCNDYETSIKESYEEIKQLIKQAQ